MPAANAAKKAATAGRQNATPSARTLRRHAQNTKTTTTITKRRRATTAATATPTAQQNDEILIDPGTIPAQQDPGKANVRPDIAVEGDVMTVKIRLPHLPPGSRAPIDAVRELYIWWLSEAAVDAANVIPKAIEYSSEDLFLLGRTLVETMGLDLAKYTRGDLEELGIYFYCSGKHARWSGAIREGRRVSDDTNTDEIIYRFMVRRIRAAGRWPGVKLH